MQTTVRAYEPRKIRIAYKSTINREEDSPESFKSVVARPTVPVATPATPQNSSRRHNYAPPKYIPACLLLPSEAGQILNFKT